MKVYALFFNCFFHEAGQFYVAGVFDTKERAEKAAKTLVNKRKRECQKSWQVVATKVQEMELNELNAIKAYFF